MTRSDPESDGRPVMSAMGTAAMAAMAAMTHAALMPLPACVCLLAVVRASAVGTAGRPWSEGWISIIMDTIL